MNHQSHRLRMGRHSEAYRPYLITTTSRDRTPWFHDFEPALETARALDHYERRGWCQSWAWVVMPDHVHWLVSPCPGVSLARLVQGFKGLSARKVNAVLDRPGGSIWQPGYHDHALRREADLRATARYVIANPVRAGLVTSVRDYPFWDACWL